MGFFQGEYNKTFYKCTQPIIGYNRIKIFYSYWPKYDTIRTQLG